MRFSCYLVAKNPTEVWGSVLNIPLFFLEMQVFLVKVDDMVYDLCHTFIEVVTSSNSSIKLSKYLETVFFIVLLRFSENHLL